jgi:hypothetical protein
MKMDEEKIDRRVHMVYWIVAGIVLATSWCVRLEFTVAGLKSDMEQQKRTRDESISQIWNRFGMDHDSITKLQQWVTDNEMFRVQNSDGARLGR